MEGRPMQTEEGISDVLHRARQRRLQRRAAVPTHDAAGSSSSGSFGQSRLTSQGGQSVQYGMREE